MPILHLLRTSPFSSSQFENMLTMAACDDKIVLVDDGCYLLHHPQLSACADITHQAIVIIDEHRIARNLSITNNIESITYEELITMFTQYNSTITW